MSNTVKVAQLPGKVVEIVVEENATVANALEIAGFESTGFEVKADGRTITDLNEQVGSASMILLAKRVKGNADTLKVAQLPGKVVEIVVENGATVADALETAGFDASGFELKLDGAVVDQSASVSGASMLLLAKRVKGNADTLKVAQLPGKVVEIVVQDGATVADALTTAGFDATGFELKLDGAVVDQSASVAGASMLLLAKQVKGNVKG